MSTAEPATRRPPNLAVIPHERIALRAYEKWCRRGCMHGRDVQDWLEAEEELQGEALRRKLAAPARPYATLDR